MKIPKTPQAAPRRKIRERDNDWITANYWITIGLTRSQVRAMTRLGRYYKVRQGPCATMARLLISLGLLNLKATRARLDALLHYIEAEGFNSLGVYCDHVMRAQCSLPEK